MNLSLSNRSVGAHSKSGYDGSSYRGFDWKNWRFVNEKAYLEPYVEVEEADGSLFSEFILFLHSSHLNNTQTLRLGWQGLHTQRLEAVLNDEDLER